MASGPQIFDRILLYLPMLDCRHTADVYVRRNLVEMNCPFASSCHLNQRHRIVRLGCRFPNFQCAHVAQMMELQQHRRIDLRPQHSRHPTFGGNTLAFLQFFFSIEYKFPLRSVLIKTYFFRSNWNTYEFSERLMCGTN